MEKPAQNGKIYVVYHKPASILEENFIVPIHAGRMCVEEKKDCSKMASQDERLKEMIGDDTGENISARNNEFNECSVLYWIWKNTDYEKLDYIGLFQYRRQLILNDVFEEAKEDFEKKVYKCVHFKKTNKDFCKKIGLTDEKISSLLKKYDCIVPYATDLMAMGISSPYEDWVRKIPGVHVSDLIMLEKFIANKYPEMKEEFEKYLNSPQKRMYHIFIAKPAVMKEYCKWLFDILFEIDRQIDTTLYSLNGKRTIGYLAEILFGFYFTYMKNNIKIKECGVSFIDR